MRDSPFSLLFLFGCYLIEFLSFVYYLLQLCSPVLCQNPGSEQVYDVISPDKVSLFICQGLISCHSMDRLLLDIAILAHSVTYVNTFRSFAEAGCFDRSSTSFVVGKESVGGRLNAGGYLRDGECVFTRGLTKKQADSEGLL